LDGEKLSAINNSENLIVIHTGRSSGKRGCGREINLRQNTSRTKSDVENITADQSQLNQRLSQGKLETFALR
jgi:hypothetical protein